MSNDQNMGLRLIFDRAKKSSRGEYSVYQMYRRQIEGLCLSNDEYENAVKRLAEILRV